MVVADTAARLAQVVQWTALIVIVACTVVLARLLPIGPGINLLRSSLAEWGFAGILLFGLLYIISTVLLFPASALTALAGVVFGIWRGTMIVSLASTLGASLAFFLGRYALRNSLERRLSTKPRFAAIDRAVTARGGVIITLLRLSPIVPFNLSNYFFGVTGIGFWRYAITSWIGMLPGTLLYVYLGYTAGAAAGAGAVAGPLHWTLLLAGLSLVLAVSVYVTRVARRALASVAETGATEMNPSVPGTSPPPRGARPIRTLILSGLAVLMLGLTACAWFNRSALAGLFGPPPVKSVNKFKANANGPPFSNALFNEVVGRYVEPGGWVDYAGLATHPQDLNAYIAKLAKAPFAKLGRNHKLALLINAYNAFTLRLILDHYPAIRSIRDIPADKRWAWVHWNIGGRLYSLEQIELMLRSDFADPRIHFAINCASIGCPPLRREAYEAATLNAQLNSQAQIVNNDPRWVRLSRGGHRLHLTSIYQWYGGDFEQAAGSVLTFVARYNQHVAAELAKGAAPDVVFMPYNWNLDSIQNRLAQRGGKNNRGYRNPGRDSISGSAGPVQPAITAECASTGMGQPPPQAVLRPSGHRHRHRGTGLRGGGGGAGGQRGPD